jgi:broad specificity phosphatase PhoE
MEAVLDRTLRGDVLVVGHGAVGTLLLCHYRKIPISRAHDQPAGGGNYFTVLRSDQRVLQTWRPMEKPPSALG